MRITQKSEFIGIGDTNVSADVPIDLAGTARVSAPDLGAYQHIVIED